MAKLELKEFCYRPIENSVKVKLERTAEHRALIKEANAKMEKDHIRYASAYNKAGSYLGN